MFRPFPGLFPAPAGWAESPMDETNLGRVCIWKTKQRHAQVDTRTRTHTHRSTRVTNAQISTHARAHTHSRLYVYTKTRFCVYTHTVEIAGNSGERSRAHARGEHEDPTFDTPAGSRGTPKGVTPDSRLQSAYETRPSQPKANGDGCIEREMGGLRGDGWPANHRLGDGCIDREMGEFRGDGWQVN